MEVSDLVDNVLENCVKMQRKFFKKGDVILSSLCVYLCNTYYCCYFVHYFCFMCLNVFECVCYVSRKKEGKKERKICVMQDD